MVYDITGKPPGTIEWESSRLNRLYVELLKDNPEWGKAERRHDMNHFMARLIFCFFAEDTDIFVGKGRFTDTVAQMSARDSSNTHEVIGTLFRAMNTEARGARRRQAFPAGPTTSPTSTAVCSPAASTCRASARSPGPTCCTSAVSTGPRSTRTSSAR